MFDDADLRLLADHLLPGTSPATALVRRIPWSWHSLGDGDRATLARAIDAYVEHFNTTHVTSDDDTVPQCWRLHPGLADDLAVMLWLWYTAYLDPAARLPDVADYVSRHVPSFATRLNRHLGRSPAECRAGQHPKRWRSSAM